MKFEKCAPYTFALKDKEEKTLGFYNKEKKVYSFENDNIGFVITRVRP